MLDVRTVKLGEFCPTCRAVVVIPSLAPTPILAKLQSQSLEVTRVVDPPLVLWSISNHRTLPAPCYLALRHLLAQVLATQ
jgi:hypothetical protein